jgi:cytochrome c peroxidase
MVATAPVAVGLLAAGCYTTPDVTEEAALASTSSGSGDSGGGSGGNAARVPLSAVPVPQPPVSDIINRAAAIRLGKALFWDTQTGGDGQTACASCHFHAGADNRLINTLHPGPNGIFESGGVTAAGQTFTPASFNNDDRVGSQGVVGTVFSSVDPNPEVAADVCSADQATPFYANRRVTGRNTPPALMAVFNRDNFWDGRANHHFNFFNPFGDTANGVGGAFIDNASLASQAVGPPNNETEMSCLGRTFNGANSLAAKMLARRPLRWQQVSKTDGVLGGLSRAPDPGLNTTYGDMIAAAFGSAFAADAQNKFSRIWGQAIQAYESTLVPDQTPFDRFLAGNSAAMTDSQKRGMDRFNGKGGCINCHAGSETTDASVSFANARGLINEDGGDQGFHNIGVTPTAQDLGRGNCPGGACDFSGPGHFPLSVSGSPKDRGAFKTPALRNVKLTAPYFHNGSKATLEDVVDFYARGGDVANPEKAKRIQPLSLDAGDRAALVDFLRNGLTDCRVEKERAPFDHPALPVPNGTSLAAVGAAGLGFCP